MDQQEKQEMTSTPMPILQRLDRLDRLLQFLEQKHGLSSSAVRHSSCPACETMEPEDQCKTLSSAIEEVNLKGTLVERVAMLENRVLQLSQEMDIESASSSSRSNILVSEKIWQGSAGLPIVDTPQHNQECGSSEACARKQQGGTKGRKSRTNIVSMGQLRGRFRWTRMGC